MSDTDSSRQVKPKLSECGFNRHSQFGEDGIVQKIFELIGTQSKLCVEFGAWDGFHLSNTANLWTNGWKGVLIEGHSARYADLVKNVRDYQCTCIEAYVRLDGTQSLEALLLQNGISETVDLLSIDIDGDDYHIFSGLDKLRPRVVVCEYNPTIPANIDLYAEYGNQFGASVAALERVGRDKGYRLIAITDTNCFFVLDGEFPRFSEFETSIDGMGIDRHLAYIMTSYRGDFVVSQETPYGLRRPYRGNLVGPHVLPVLRSPLSGIAAQLCDQLKNLVKPFTGKGR